MPISPMDEYLAHQTHETFDRVYTSDRNFYDRYYFNCYSKDGAIFLVTGMGQYPNLGVTDAFVSVSKGTRQFTVRASRELGSDRLDTSVGPFRTEVIEGLRTLRVRCDENDWGVDLDLTFRAQAPALEEPQSFTRASWGRVTQNVARYAQVGTWEGRLRVDGASYEVHPERWQGARDHSWGVRQVGEPVPPGIALRDIAKGVTGFFHNWLPMQFDDHWIKVTIDEDYAGNRLVEESRKMYYYGVDRPDEPMGRPSVEIDYHSGSRELKSALLTFDHPSGKPIRSRSTPLRTVYLAAGSGYMPSEDWGHGYYKGALAVEGVVHELGTPEQRRPYATLNETLCRFDLDDGSVGYGMHENLCVGVYRPAGFDTLGAVAR